MGWLSAKPDKSKETRAQLYGERLPELPLTEDLQDHWAELGRARECQVGLLPFEWQEIEAYARLNAIQLSPFEAQTLVDMSRAFANGYADTNPLSIEPMERRNG